MATNSLTGGLADPQNLMLMQMMGPMAQQIVSNPAYVAQQAAMKGSPPVFAGTQGTPAAKPKAGAKKGDGKDLEGNLAALSNFAQAIQGPVAPEVNLPSPGSGNSMNAQVPSSDLAAVMNAMMNQTMQRQPIRTMADLLKG